MELWEQILLAVMGLGILLLFWPGVKQVIRESEQARERDWAGFLIPIALVIALVILMIYLSR